MADLSLRHVTKRYPNVFTAVKDFNLEMKDGEFVILTGKKGCGKSTVLRMIAGAEDVTNGEIQLDGKIIHDQKPENREIAMVFQYYSLYPHMTVYDNLSFGMRLRKIPEEQIDIAVREAAGMLGLYELLNRRLSVLSEGQKQRVSLGRAIVRKPKLFLFDEPLYGLEEKVQIQIRTEIEKLHENMGATILYAAHNRAEAEKFDTEKNRILLF
ncbi:MAG: ABC transporter ATP-binding protein [Lachnospiraceae bacterium]|nr:ABC transporter ATP-binding protein [Lachnospiraceae bacterium]